MRFKKGDRVEVMNQNEIPVSWCVGEILSGNGPTYRVKYDNNLGMCNNEMVEIVSAKFMRPCPPLLRGVESCTPGDIVEVFHDHSWKLASILKIPKDIKHIKSHETRSRNAKVQKKYVVRLLGCLQEVLVDKSVIRVRQIWNDGKWILIGKHSHGDEGFPVKALISNRYQKSNFQITPLNARVNKKHRQDHTNFLGNVSLQESHMVSSRSLKRISPYDSSFIEPYNGGVQKSRAVEKNGTMHKLISNTPVFEKVHAIAHPKDLSSRKSTRNVVNTTSNGYNPKQSGFLGSFADRIFEQMCSDSDECSVGSCSATDQGPNNRYDALMTIPYTKRDDTLSSDAESCSGSGFNRKTNSYLPSNEEEAKVGIRKLEMHAYRCTLEALYASGPLSWEQEAMLTDLRIMLHISNDDHSMELKHLSKNAGTVR